MVLQSGFLPPRADPLNPASNYLTGLPLRDLSPVPPEDPPLVSSPLRDPATSKARSPKRRVVVAPFSRDNSLLRTKIASCKLGNRRRRRWENLSELQANLLPRTPEDPTEELEGITTCFERLLLSDSLRQRWDFFTELPQQEQDRLVHHPPHNNCTVPVARDVDSAESRFNGLSRTLRKSLSKLNVPYMAMEELERTVALFFSETPTSTIRVTEANPFIRVLLHAICCYHQLQSQSHTEKDERITVIGNTGKSYARPDILLCDFLQTRSYQ